LINSMSVLLNPKSIAVVGASPTRNRAKSLLQNLGNADYKGEVFAINPQYTDVLGYRCFPAIESLPSHVDCVVTLVGADAAIDSLERAFAMGTRAAVVPSAGFGEGGHGAHRGERLRRLSAGGMAVCGPNCFGVLNVKSGVTLYSGTVSFPLRPGPVAIVSQSGGLGHNAFSPLINHRQLGFRYVISCGNASNTTVEDYVSHLVDDPEINIIAGIIETLTKPQLLFEAAQRARERRKTLVFFQPGRSKVGQAVVRSHTGALVRDCEVLAAFLRRCGIVQIDNYDTFVEAIELLAWTPRDDKLAQELFVLTGSGGTAAVAADALEAANVQITQLAAQTVERIGAALPDFGSVNNPLDGTGAIYDDAKLLPELMAAILANPGNAAIACAVSPATSTEQMLRIAGTFADAAKTSGRTVVAFQPNPLGAALKPELVARLHDGRVPLLLGVSEAMRAIKSLFIRQEFWSRPAPTLWLSAGMQNCSQDRLETNFMSLREALTKAGVSVIPTCRATSEDEAIAAARDLGMPVAIKAEAPGLLHRSDIGAVRVGCATADDVARSYRAVVANATKAGFTDAYALVQPMARGITEAYAGIIQDPTFGPAVVFGLGGIFIEVFKDTVSEMAPLTQMTARRMIADIKGAAILQGTRGQQQADLEALAAFLVALGDFAIAKAGQFSALDINPIIVGAQGSGVSAVDIMVEV
jgi:acetate---CoA ligase (ADP-forming)